MEQLHKQIRKSLQIHNKQVIILIKMSIIRLLFYILNLNIIFAFKASELDFTGRILWKQGDLNDCDIGREFVANRHLNSYRCYRYRIYYEWIKVEVLSLDPPILKYPSFLKPTLIRKFLNYTNTVKIGRLIAKGNNATNDSRLSEARVINGAFLRHNQDWETTQFYNFIQHRLLAFDFSVADKFQILRLESESHHIPHYDFLRKHHDLAKRGNRMATLVFTFKTAQFGGDTIFPNKRIVVHPEPGDALIWLNMNPKYERTTGSLRGECPVVWGEKMTLTVWVRSKGQELRYKCPLVENKQFSLDPLIRPKLSLKNLLLYELNVLFQKFLEDEEYGIPI